MERDYFASPGRLTELTDEQVSMVRNHAADPRALGIAVQRLLVSPGEASASDAFGTDLSEQQMIDRNTRPAAELLSRAARQGQYALGEERQLNDRIVGTCRDHAVLSTAMLRANGVPARARCGFASYFVAGKFVDHWVTEYRHATDQRWVRIDTEVLGAGVLERPEELTPTQFFSGGEAWQQVRSGALDPDDFGVFGTENWGIGEVRGNVMRDVAALRRIEMLPWDEWGQMTASYDGETDDDFDELMDRAAAACAAVDDAGLDVVYDELADPEALLA